MRRVPAAVLLALAAAGTAPTVAAQDLPLVTVHVDHPGRDVRVEVNGYPVTRSDASTRTLVTQVTPWLVDGENRVEVRFGGGEVVAPVAVEVRRRGDDAPLGRTASPEGEAEGTLALDVAVDVPVRWSWQDAPEVEVLDADDRAEIRAAVAALHDAYARGAADEVVERSRRLFVETALLRPGVLERVRERYRSLMAADGWGMEPLDEEGLRFAPAGRMVHVSAPGPVLRSRPLPGRDGSRLEVEGLLFARLDGVWTPVRATR